ncbi:uncharacterized protein LOC119629802 [Bombyx mori]
MSHTERSISPIGSLKLDVPSASTVSTLKELNARRSSVRGRITKYKNFFNKISETQPTLQVDLCMLNQRYESLREMFSKFDELQTQIEIMNTANLEAELDIRDDIETDFSSLIAKTQLFLEANQTQREDFRPANSEICSNCSNPSQHISGFKLPTIKIANFDGTYFKWLEFRDTFTSLIHSNNKIESVHKFHYLNSYLEGEAAHVISNLEVSSANYDEAWQLLCERYNNEKQLISNHLNSLCNLQPVSRDSSKDLKFLIDHISKNLRALNTLGEPTASWDTLVIHLVTSKLDSSTNFKWEEHRSNFKRSPSLKDFFCFLKARADILESIQLNRTERASINKRPLNSFDLSKGQRPQTRSFVISAGQSSSSSTSICVLCGGDHRLYDCATFLAKSIADRTAEVQEHLRLLHAGPQLLLSTVREFVWPIAGRDLARATVRQCIVCRRASAKMLAPMMGALPSQRVDPDFPFISAGIDFCGPFLITDRKGRGCKISKCYMCVFVCLRYKCLHLEAVSDLTKEAFILSLRRFISRRGKPKEIFCDNGRNFVSASKEITESVNSHADGVGGFLSSEGIDFKFQPAYAPHFGGLWEASVKSAKFHLKRILDNTHCTFEELATLFNQIEAILNSRPLCPLSSSPDDLAPLTPGHFLIGRPLTSLPSPNYMQLSTSRLSRYQHLEQIRQHFWNRWQLEYLNELQQRHKWRVPARSIQNGDLVLLKDENIPPMQWRTGRVINLFPGKDNIVRVAEIKTSTGVYRRGLRYLCPLLDTAEDSSLEANASKAPEDVKDL